MIVIGIYLLGIVLILGAAVGFVGWGLWTVYNSLLDQDNYSQNTSQQADESTSQQADESTSQQADESTSQQTDESTSQQADESTSQQADESTSPNITQTKITKCMIIDQPGKYVLENDIVESWVENSQSCIYINGDNIEVDCDSHQIIGEDIFYRAFHVYGSNNIVKNCRVSGFIFGFFVMGNNSKNNLFFNNTISNCQDGILTYSGSTSMINNTVTNCDGAGFNLWAPCTNPLNGNVVIGNVADNNWHGISAMCNDNLKIVNNTVTNSGHYGIHIYESTEFIQENNVVSNSGKEDIHVQGNRGTSYYDLTDDICSMNNAKTSDCEVTDCTVIYQPGTYRLCNNICTSQTASGSTCLEIAASNVVLDGNGYNIVGTGYGYGIRADGVENVYIINNNVQKFAAGIILTNSFNSTIQNNSVKFSNNGDGIHIRKGSHNAVINNNLNGNGDDGIEIQEEEFSHVTNNWINGSDSSGIYVSDYSKNLVIEGNTIQNGVIGLNMRGNSESNTYINNFICYNLRNIKDESKVGNTFTSNTCDSVNYCDESCN
ncbi:right-handed parallel beta-helix repeat-containing protein [Candidatus Micrarchaeota archaeon]|nr:right-handed parallel beta-helix repeat-containing protein [Candidatus Micrarchaeota archaeon]